MSYTELSFTKASPQLRTWHRRQAVGDSAEWTPSLRPGWDVAQGWSGPEVGTRTLEFQCRLFLRVLGLVTLGLGFLICNSIIMPVLQEWL